MKKIKVSFGKLEVRQILDDYISPTMTVESQPVFILTDNEAVMNFILQGLKSEAFNIEESFDPPMLPFFKQN